MKIGIISDSHYSSQNYLLPKSISLAFSGVDLIIHAGDITHPSVLKELNKIAPVRAVRGNKRGDHRNFSENLPKHLIFTLAGLNFAVIHCPSNRFMKEISHLLSLLGLQKLSDWILIRELFSYFKNEARIDCLIFGDTHQPFCRKRKNILFLNPGASCPTTKRPGSVLVAEIKNRQVICRLTYFFS